MGRKKKKPVKPWCWYCNREFDDDKILIQHQRAKHFKCPFCHKKLYSGPGLTVHCIQVHKETLDKIPEALPNKNSVDIDIYGMQGIPEDDIREHERLKRGEDVSSKPPDSASKSQQQPQYQQKSQPSQTNVQHPAMTAMHAAMFQHAMGLGAMPPGFPVPPPTSLPHGPPPGFMPPGFPPMSMLPGLPQPPMGFHPSMMPPSTLANPMGQHLGFQLPPHMGPVPSTSLSVPPPPPPMSGVGPLIGLMPPQYPPHMDHTSAFRNQAANISGNQDSRSSDQRQSNNHQLRSQAVNSSSATNTTTANSGGSDSSAAKPSSTSSSTTITKPASTMGSSGIEESNLECDSYISIPGTKSRIMHPSKNLSLEEIRLNLKKYRNMLDKLPEKIQVPADETPRNK